MSKRNVIVVLILLIGVIGLSIPGASVVRAQDGTVPTRTPTPDPNQPTRVSPTATRDGSGNPPPAATQTSTAAPTATGTQQAGQLTATPTLPSVGTVTGGTLQSGSAPAGGCDETPYIRAIVRLTTYAGPGADYDPVATLEPQEMRRITGRAADATWWQIQLDAATVGWVHAREVDEFGNTALVTTVDTPPRNRVTATPGVPWNPTPLPLLTCVPTPTPSATPTSTQTPPAVESGSGAGETGATNGGGQSVGATPEQSVVETTGNETAQGGVAMPPGPGVSSRGSESSRAASPTSSTNLILPIAGLALIGGGIILALLSRNRVGKQGPPSQ